MRVSLLTDAPKHNLALMKLSRHHKMLGNQVIFNMPIIPADYTYASVLFEKNAKKFIADEYGGPAYERSVLPPSVEQHFPDYSLYNINFSLGYTFRPCPRRCSFCKVPNFNHPNIEHHSIYTFHNSAFKRICLLNNNTFSDPQWQETFDEIHESNLTVIDENGYDLRLIDDEKAFYLRQTKFEGYIHYAWDRMKDEKKILRGLEVAPRGRVYVLIGCDTTEQEDIYRCQKIIDYGHDPYIMPYIRNVYERRFKRFIDSFMWRKYNTLEKAWQDYNP